jgi:hypothetical protein
MSSITDFTLVDSDWSDLTTAAGTVAGASMIVQNLSIGKIRVEVSTAEPASENLGLSLDALGGSNDTANAQPAAGESVWALSVSGNQIVHVELT